MKKRFLLTSTYWPVWLVVFCLLTNCDDFFHSSHPSGPSLKAKADVALDWYKLQLQIIRKANPAIAPTVVARIFGYNGIALYESVRDGIPHSYSLSASLYQMPTMPAKPNGKYSPEISANAALAMMVRSMFPNLTAPANASIDSLENLCNEKLKPSMHPDVFTRSQNFGRSIAEAVFNWSKTDNDNQSPAGYVPPVFDGAWVPTPPAFALPASPYQGNARPFIAEDVTALAPAFTIPYSEDPSSDFYKMVRDLYDVSLTLTPEQKNIALFWNDIGVGKGYTPPGHSMSILNQVLENRKENLGVAAIAYAKIGIALRDALIVVFRSKYTYNLIRPVSYIREVIDPNWMPLLITPAHPEYPAAHACVTSAAMRALTGVFGESCSITDHTYDFLGYPSRSYSSLNDAGTESGMSRRLGGIHYLNSINIGLSLGRDIGSRVAAIQVVGQGDEP